MLGPLGCVVLGILAVKILFSTRKLHVDLSFAVSQRRSGIPAAADATSCSFCCRVGNLFGEHPQQVLRRTRLLAGMNQSYIKRWPVQWSWLACSMDSMLAISALHRTSVLVMWSDHLIWRIVRGVVFDWVSWYVFRRVCRYLKDRADRTLLPQPGVDFTKHSYLDSS